MLATPDSEWLYTGSWPFSIYGVSAEQVERRYPGFSGPGWYPAHKILVEDTGTLRDGKATYRVAVYAADPRPAMAAAAALPTR